MYIFYVALNYALSFQRLMAMCVKLLKIIDDSKVCIFSENMKGWHLAYEGDAHSLH